MLPARCEQTLALSFPPTHSSIFGFVLHIFCLASGEMGTDADMTLGAHLWSTPKLLLTSKEGCSLN